MGKLAARAALEETKARGVHTPIVFAVVSDPVGGGLVASYESSGNHVTGVTPRNEAIAGKRISLLRELIPNARRILLLWNDPQTTGIEEVRRAAALADLELIERHVENEQEIDNFLGSFVPERTDVLLRAPDPLSARRVQEMADWAARHRIPLVGTNAGDVVRGALMSYGADYYRIGEQAAYIVDRILTGAAPSSIPIESAEKFELVVNRRTVGLLDITIPEGAFSQIDRFVE